MFTKVQTRTGKGHVQGIDRVGTLALAGIVLAGVLAPTAQAARYRQVQCKPGYQSYEEQSRKLRTTWSSRARNLGGSTDRYTLVVTRSGTYSTTLSAGMETEVGGGFGPFQASVKVQFNRDISRSTTATRGERLTVSVPPRREVRVRYGVWTRRYKGIVLSKRDPDPSAPEPLWPTFPPANCSLHLVDQYSVRAATPETGFEKSKPRRFDG